ncbi:MAG: hypothetical protein K0R78_1692 [Pelosinus sp.]|nr:hypothetical protein [Pelosinus sp.]
MATNNKNNNQSANSMQNQSTSQKLAASKNQFGTLTATADANNEYSSANQNQAANQNQQNQSATSSATNNFSNATTQNQGTSKTQQSKNKFGTLTASADENKILPKIWRVTAIFFYIFCVSFVCCSSGIVPCWFVKG